MDLIISDNLTFKIRPMIHNDLYQAIRLSNSEGWNQTEKDWKILLENARNTCIVAVCNSEVIGTATALNHSDKVAWIGMVLVSNSYRGHGVGKALLSNIIGELKNFASIKLDATPAGRLLYLKLGFTDEYRIIRMINPSIRNNDERTFKYKPIAIDKSSLPEVLIRDKKIFGTDRSYLLRALLYNYPKKAYLIKGKKNLNGFIFGRNGYKFNYIGPVSANSDESAKILIWKALESLNHQPVALDILYDKVEVIKWLESLGFVKKRDFVRMYLKNNSYCGLIKHQYLISGPEFG